ncbi:MAG TPA: hypothetical protein ENO05_08885 [Bacteroides sp.]|nr:hypothetical protein [Bacteroides sp.]
MKSSYFILAAFALMILAAGCNKEEPRPVSAAFTTNLTDHTAMVGKAVTFYTGDATGDFLTYFKGDKEANTFGTGYGTSLEVGTDSFNLIYNAAGSYTFTLVATSYGNWGETMEQDVQSVDITVVPNQ